MSEEHDIQEPTRGTASKGSPVAGTVPEQNQREKIIIKDPRGGHRVYDLTEDVREYLESTHRTTLEAESEWYEMWWEGNELVIEYCGNVREPGSRNFDPEQDQHQGLPRYPSVPWMPREKTPQATIDLDELEEKMQENGQSVPDPKSFDKSLLPVHNITRVNMQDRADKNPLSFEDIFIALDEEPVEQEDDDTDASAPDIDDVREMTDGDETLQKGKRGNRYNL